MKKYTKTLILLSILIIVFYLIFSIKKDNKFIEFNNIENFKPNNLIDKSIQDNYFLYYPSDMRVSQSFTLIKQIDNKGNLINSYKIFDDNNINRFNIHPKIEDKENLYLSFYPPNLNNTFYKFDLSNNTFNKINLDYINSNVGVENIKHQGNDILFSTMSEYTKEEEKYNTENFSFKTSISNFTTKQFYDLPYGYTINLQSNLLNFNNNIVCSVIDENNKNALAFLNESGNFKIFTSPEIENEYLYLISCDNDTLYLITENNKFIKLKKDLKYKITEFNKNYPNYLYDSSLLLDENNILVSLVNSDKKSSKNNKTILGILTIKPTIQFTPINTFETSKGSIYKFQYMNKYNNIFIIEDKQNDKGNVIILDYNNNFNIKNKIPILYPHLLDLIVEIKN